MELGVNYAKELLYKYKFVNFLMNQDIIHEPKFNKNPTTLFLPLHLPPSKNQQKNTTSTHHLLHTSNHNARCTSCNRADALQQPNKFASTQTYIGSCVQCKTNIMFDIYQILEVT